MEAIIPSAIWVLFLEFRSAFSAPTFENFVMLTTGWILCFRHHTITQAIRFGRDFGRAKHHSVFYRFFSRAKWTAGKVGKILLRMVLKSLPGPEIYLIVDDTLCSKSGPQVWGAGMHHDARRSTYMRGVRGKRKTILTYGHCWVVVSVWIPFPWNPLRGLAIPVRWQLYRQKKRCPKEDYRKRTEIARELLLQILEELPPEYEPIVLGDREYCCKTVIPAVQGKATFIGTMPMNAAFYDLPPKRKPRRGRPRKKGKRLSSPQELADDDSIPWEEVTVTMYRKNVTFLAKRQVGLWYHVTRGKSGQMLVTRDPKGRIRDGAYFCTDPELDVPEIACAFARRWAQEIMHRDVKQHLGLEDPQNGWWRRPHGEKRKKRPGPQAHERKGARAVQRTVTIPLVAYALVVLHYLQVGSPAATIAEVLARAPWYRHKKEPSFADMLGTAKKAIWATRFSANPTDHVDLEKTAAALPDWLLAAA